MLGEAEVPVANCGESYFDSHLKSNWTLKDFLIYVKEYKNKDYSTEMPCLYLKVRVVCCILNLSYIILLIRIGTCSKISLAQ
jgi:hypothetical protein